ncbi:YqcC family protein [Vibrio sp. SS-MA-C1-2]|uniref:YqcC family protein n=1 Tax=Vibrio sp. SS-MA-C1-2 TaxID=2908646 RepID=UPI001F219A8A|nr:YqcC family protein [Vibrio sp. SS-MA-C1-2]UJF18907.1 YqcC family protein [Vibrio sp. SS-MA-C1-2]
MLQRDACQQQLAHLEQLLKRHDLWSLQQPSIEALSSVEPFCIDTLTPIEWLQWVLIPKLNFMLQHDHPLPTAFDISPYFSEALKAHQYQVVIVEHLQELDQLFKGEV